MKQCPDFLFRHCPSFPLPLKRGAVWGLLAYAGCLLSMVMCLLLNVRYLLAYVSSFVPKIFGLAVPTISQTWGSYEKNFVVVKVEAKGS